MSSKTSGQSSGTVPRLMLRVPTEAAQACGISDETFDRWVRPHVRLVQLGRFFYVTVKELERWSDSNSARTLRDGSR
jgi:hypothetical protein